MAKGKARKSTSGAKASSSTARKRPKPSPTETKRDRKRAKDAGSRRTPVPTPKRRSRPKRDSGRVRAPAPSLPRAELRRRLEIARGAAARGEPLVKRWLRALERCRNHVSDQIGRQPVLRTVAPPPAVKGTPWALVARISGFDGLLGYEQLWAALRAIDDDDAITDGIGARRISRLQIRYRGVSMRGGGDRVERDFVLAEIAPWRAVVSRALERLDPGVEDSITALYGQGPHATEVAAIFVWISTEEASAPSWIAV